MNYDKADQDLTDLPIFQSRRTTGHTPPSVRPQQSPRDLLAAMPPATPKPPEPEHAESGQADEKQAGINWGEVRAFRQQAADRLADTFSAHFHVDDAERRRVGSEIINQLLDEHVRRATQNGHDTYTPEQQDAMAKAIYDALFGLGRLQPYVEDEDVENIEVYGAQKLICEHSDGRLTEHPPIADSEADLRDMLSFLATRGGATERTFSEASPDLHLNLTGGYRLAAVGWVTHTTVVNIRRHRLVDVDIDQLQASGTVTPEMAAFLTAAVRARRSILVAGGQGFGKTTLIRALANAIDPMEKLGTIETEYELHLQDMPDRHKRIIAWQARPGSGERDASGRMAGEITLDDLVFNALRHNLDRMIVGEVRGKEVLPMFKAMQSGAGSLSTTHAHSARAAIERLITCAMEAGSHVSEPFAYRQVAEHIDLIVHITRQDVRDADGTVRRRRYVDEVVAVEPGEHGRPALTDVFYRDHNGDIALGSLPPWIDQLADYGYVPSPAGGVIA